MCMLCVIPPNAIPDRKKLENSALNNPHGYGFAIVVPEENRIICERTMNADDSINRFLELRAHYPSGYAMWHARFATSGEQTVDNCHPFVLPDKEHPNTTYVGHNGILDVIEPKGEKRSDTRIFVEDLLPAIGGVKALDNDQVWNLINEFTRGSKVCVLTIHPKAEYQMYLFHEEAGKTDEDGVWWSNNSCELTYGYGGKWWSADPYVGGSVKGDKYDHLYDMFSCEMCGTDTHMDLVEDDFCPTCYCCFMCTFYKDACMCYKPSRHEADRVVVKSVKDKKPSDMTLDEQVSYERFHQNEPTAEEENPERVSSYKKPEGGGLVS